MRKIIPILMLLTWATIVQAAPLNYLGNASSTALSANSFCLTLDTCRTTWPTFSASFSFPFTKQGNNDLATSTTLDFFNGFNSTASSTVSSLCFASDCKSAWPSFSTPFAWPFTKQGDASQGTTTLLSFIGGFESAASSSINSTLSVSGNVGIGTTTPSRLLSVAGNEYLTGSFNDAIGSPGINGQVLTSTITGTAWSSSLTTPLNATTTAVLTGQTASLSSVNTYTPTASSTYMIIATTDVTAEAVQTLTVSVSYTDSSGTSRTQNFFGMGLTTAALSSLGDSNFPPMTIRPLKNTAITIATTVTGVGSISYNIDASIIPISTQ